ncbi:exonuclease SbcCD subunit D [Salibacterium aidingense]|uniref:exonuclease SbcCD subunit D n=1 Tax=Salibacterium aidingense TaxID=384933 RepID=UPI0004156A28|nr:exonuclease SbcCD subunit D [Salibacterium aidingense]
MRIIHTADWHLGRTLEGRSRFPEHIAFFDELERIIQEEEADVLVMAGDVFDSVNPPADAESLFYESMVKINSRCRIPIVLIAGNHDHPERLAAPSQLAEAHDIYILGYPQTSPLFIPVNGDLLQLAALPYPSESRLQAVFSRSADESAIRNAYNERIKSLFHMMTRSFEKQHVRLAMTHVFAAGGTASESERPIEVGGAYSLTGEAFPENVQYTALGHLHRPQAVHHGDRTIRYAGSPLAFSFSEAGYAKSVTLLDITPEQEQPVIREIPLSCGKPLVRWEAEHGMNQVKQWLEAKRDREAWVELYLHLNETPSMEDIHYLRKHHPGIVHIYPVFPEQETQPAAANRNQLPIDELFQRFYEKQTGGAEPEQELIDRFMELIAEEGEDE